MNISPELFRDAFVAAFKINRHFIRWSTPRQRTSHMVSHIYRTIADYLDLTIEYEYNSLDAVFYDRDAEKPDARTVRIAVEHENRTNLAHDEVWGLVNHNFPLSVLITYAWNGKTGGVIVDASYPQKQLTEQFGSSHLKKPLVSFSSLLLMRQLRKKRFGTITHTVVNLLKSSSNGSLIEAKSQTTVTTRSSNRIIKRIMRFLTRKGFLIEEQGMTYLTDTDLDPALGPLRAVACTYRIALGPRAGQKSTEVANRSYSAAYPGALCQRAGL